MLELDFVKTYLKLILLSSDKPADQFFSTGDYNQLPLLGPSLPLLRFPFPKDNQATSKNEQDRHIKVGFKLIKPPFKFSAEVDTPAHVLVFRVKQMLIELVPALKEAGVTPQDLKVLIKLKVVSDLAQLLLVVADDADSASATVMVSAPAASEKSEVSEGNTAKATIDATTVTPATWTKIQQALAADVGEAQATQLVAKFKAAV